MNCLAQKIITSLFAPLSLLPGSASALQVHSDTYGGFFFLTLLWPPPPQDLRFVPNMTKHNVHCKCLPAHFP